MSEAEKPKRNPRVRFSLKTLLLIVLLVGCCATLKLHWASWRLVQEIDAHESLPPDLLPVPALSPRLTPIIGMEAAPVGLAWDNGLRFGSYAVSNQQDIR